jgi:hypothetical protein
MSQEEVAGEKIMSTTRKLEQQAASSGVFRLRGELPICRLGFGAMRITGPGIWGEPLSEFELEIAENDRRMYVSCAGSGHR